MKNEHKNLKRFPFLFLLDEKFKKIVKIFDFILETYLPIGKASKYFYSLHKLIKPY